MGKAKTTPKWRSRDLTHRDAAALPTTSAAIMPLELQPRHAALPRRTQTRCRREAGEAASERGRRVAPMAARVSTAQLHLRLAALVARSRHHAHKSSSVRPSAVSARALRSSLPRVWLAVSRVTRLHFLGFRAWNLRSLEGNLRGAPPHARCRIVWGGSLSPSPSPCTTPRKRTFFHFAASLFARPPQRNSTTRSWGLSMDVRVLTFDVLTFYELMHL